MHRTGEAGRARLPMNLCAFPLISPKRECCYVKGLALIATQFWLSAGRSRLGYFQTKLARRRFQAPDRVAPVLFLVRFEALLDVGAAVPQGIVVKLGDLARRSDVGHLPAAGGPETAVKASQRQMFAASQAARGHAENAARPSAEAFVAASVFAALAAAGSQPQSGGEVLAGGT